MDKLKLHTPDLTVANIDRIAELFPNCVTEAKDENGRIKRTIDFDLLRQELSSDLVEGPQERYRLDWPGKREALALANTPVALTLRPCREESVDFENTKNLYIEGDNLDALKLLQETYLGKVKMIYIDPPYNTGNDFIYDDNFSMGRGEYDELSGDRDEDGNAMFDAEKWKQNSTSNGRFHSEWLSMLYPRLKLARNLLQEDGVIFISIDDRELANLCKIGAEIFGHENLIAIFTWVKKKKGSHLSPRIRSMTEYIVCYSRSIETVSLIGEAAYSDKWQPLAKRTNSLKTLTFPPGYLETSLDDGVYPAGAYGKGSSSITFIKDLVVLNSRISSEAEIEGPFVWTQPKLTDEILKGSRVALSKMFGLNALRHDQDNKVKRPSTLIERSCGAGTNEDAYEESIQLFGREGIMSYPKPSSLIHYLVKTATWTSESDIILDFFSGSATTAHAAMQLNAEDGGKRRHIMVQLPEPCDEKSEAFKAGYKTIAEIGKERIRRAGKKILQEWQAKHGASPDQLKLNTENPDAGPPDIGFRVLKIDSSNFRDIARTPDELEQQELALHTDHLKPDRTTEDLLFQVLVDWGVDLALPIVAETLHGKCVFFVDQNALAACFDTGLTDELVRAIAGRKPLRVVFRDDGFGNDSTRINVEQIFKLLSPGTEVKAL